MLTIIYRAYPNISKTPAIKFKSKTEIIEFCLRSALISLRGIDFEFIFINDGCSLEQIHVVEQTIKAKSTNYRRIDLGGVGNQLSFAAQLNEVRNAKYKFILVLEDDYYISEDDIKFNIEALEHKFVEYSTFYFPYDALSHSGGMKKGFLRANDGKCCLVALPSTTLTFFGKKEVILEDIEHFRTFVDGSHDSSLWLRLTSSFVFFLTRIYKPIFRKNPYLVASIIKRYFKHMTVLPRRKRLLVFSGSGLSTHLDSNGVNNVFSNIYFLDRCLSRFRRDVSE